MNYFKSVWLLVAFACLMLLIMSSCVNLKYYNESGDVDAEIIIRPSEDAIQNTIGSGEIESGIEAQIAIPISNAD